MSNDHTPALSIRKVSKSYGDLKVLKDVDLDVESKELLVLLGPSGCGKTTLLKIVAGLLEHDSGSLILKGKDITKTPPYRRDIGLVFQNYALFPHKTVFQNVAFGLKMRGLDKREIEQRVNSTLDLVRLSGMGGRSIQQLSGGQQQRVALARALVLKPSLLLMDEPLSNLDAKLRAAVRVEIAQIQKKLGLTAILVTHDQTEAMTMGDRIILMMDGIIQQSATPTDIYERPANIFVSSFIGSPQINLFPIDIRNEELAFSDFESRCPAEKMSGLFTPDIAASLVDGGIPGSGKYVAGIRPEDFLVDPQEGCAFFQGTVNFVEYLGADYFLHVTVGGKEVIVRNPQHVETVYPVGSTVNLGFKPGKVHLFEAESQNRVGLA